MFLLAMNERRNSKTWVILSGRIVNENFNPNGAYHFIDCALLTVSALCSGTSGYHWALLILWNSLFPLFLSYHTHQKPNPCPAYLSSCRKEQMTKGVCQKTLHICRKVTPQESTTWIIATFLSAANTWFYSTPFYLNMYANPTETTLMRKYYLRI